MDSDSSDSEQSNSNLESTQDFSIPSISYPLQNLNGCTSPPPATSGTAHSDIHPHPYLYNVPPLSQIQLRIACRSLSVAVVLWLIMAVTVFYIFGYVLQPKLPDFSIQSLSLSDYNTSKQSVSARWNAQFHVSNPNKIFSFDYEDVVSLIFHKDYFLTARRIGPFTVGKRNVSIVEATYSVVDLFVDGKVVDEMNEERARDQIKFNIQVLARMVFYDLWKRERKNIRVWCDDVALNGSSGKMTGGPYQCSVGWDDDD